MEILANSKDINNIQNIDYHKKSKISKVPKQSPNVVSKSFKAFFKKLKAYNTNQENQNYTNDIDSAVSFKNYERGSLAPSQSLYYKSSKQAIDTVFNDKQSFRYSLDSSKYFYSESNTCQIYSMNEQKDRSDCSSSCSSYHSEEVDFKEEITNESTPDGYKQKTTCNIFDVEAQERLWNEDATFCPADKISEWLGTSDPFRARVLHLYMQNFDFTNIRLDEAFRILCSKLYLKAESQQLDRIIEAFAKRFYDCNPTTILHSADILHAVSYSLLLLNTDLHIVYDRGNRMTKSSFVKNTMETIQVLMFPQMLSQRRRVSSFSSSDSSILRRPSVNESTPTFESQSFKGAWDDHDLHSSSGGNNTLFNKLDLIKSNISWKSSAKNQQSTVHDNLTRTQKTWVLDTESLLKEMYSAIKSRRIDQASIASTDGKARSVISQSDSLSKSDQKKEIQRPRGHSVVSENAIAIAALGSLNSHRRLTEPSPIFDPVTFKEYRQGVVMKKHVMEATEKKAKYRQWQLCYLVMNQAEMVMYKAVQQNNIRGKKRKSMIFWNQSVGSQFSLQEIVSNDTDEWYPDLTQPPLETIDLNHCYATCVLPPGWNGQRPHVFRLESAEGGLWMFESTDMFAIQAWVEAINFSAASISKSSLPGAVGNIDYGWGADLESNESANSTIPVWYLPTPCMIQSTLGLEDQYNSFKAQIKDTTEQLEKHRLLKSKLEKKYSSQGGNNTQAMANWDRKFLYISHELLKLRCYRDILKPRISL